VVWINGGTGGRYEALGKRKREIDDAPVIEWIVSVIVFQKQARSHERGDS
jgi:hypothetical protein